MNQYAIFYQIYGETRIRHYSFDIPIKNSAALTMNEIYSELRDWVGHDVRFDITSITKLN